MKEAGVHTCSSCDSQTSYKRGTKNSGGKIQTTDSSKQFVLLLEVPKHIFCDSATGPYTNTIVVFSASRSRLDFLLLVPLRV